MMTKQILLLRYYFAEFVRDKVALALAFLFPLFFLVSFSATGNQRAEFVLRVVVEGASPLLEKVSTAIAAEPGVRLVPAAADGAEPMLARGDAQMVLAPAAAADEGIRAIVAPGAALQASRLLSLAQLSLLREQGAATPFGFTVEDTKEKVPNRLSFFMPGLLCLALLQLGLFGTGSLVLQARSRGVLLRFSYWRTSPLEFIAAQVAVRVLIALLQVSIILLASRFLFGFDALPSIPLLLLFVLLGSAVFISLGYAIAGLASSTQAGSMMIMVANFAIMFLGEIFFDRNQLGSAEFAAYIIPATYLSDSLRQIVTGLPGKMPLWLNFLALCGFLSLTATVAMRGFRTAMRGNV